VTTQVSDLKEVVRNFSEDGYAFCCEPRVVGCSSRECQVLVKNKLLLAGQNIMESLAADIGVDFCLVYMQFCREF